MGTIAEAIVMAFDTERPQLAAVRDAEVSTLRGLHRQLTSEVARLRAAHDDLTGVVKALMDLPFQPTTDELLTLRERAARVLGRWLQ